MEVEVFGMAGIPEGAVPGGPPPDGAARHQSLFGPASHACMWRSAVPKCRQRICVYLLPLLDCPREILHMTTDLHSVGAALSMSPDSACSVHPKTMQALVTHLPSVWCHCRGHCRRGASHKGPESSARTASTSAPSWKTRARGSRTLDGYAHSAAVPAAPHVCTASLHFWQASCTEHCWQSSNEHIALECFITSLSWHHDRRTFSEGILLQGWQLMTGSCWCAGSRHSWEIPRGSCPGRPSLRRPASPAAHRPSCARRQAWPPLQAWGPLRAFPCLACPLLAPQVQHLHPLSHVLCTICPAW